MAIKGTITRIEVTNISKVTDPADFGDISQSVVVYVGDPEKLPYPGIAVDFGTTDVTTTNTTLDHTPSEWYLKATTGSFV
jgi:hypothetical protein